MPRGRASLMGSWWIGLAAAALLAWATSLPLCDAIFDCGCRWFFEGGVAHCNIHQPGPPDCPVCTKPLVGAVYGLGLFGVWTALIRLGQRLLPS